MILNAVHDSSIKVLIRLLAKNRKNAIKDCNVREKISKRINPTNQELNIDFHMTDRCNLHCLYCYREAIPGKTDRSIDFSIAKKVLDRAVYNQYQKVTLQFIGGEPLLCFKEIKEITEYADKIFRRNNIRYGCSITTNGILINDEMAKFFKAYKYHVTVSIDGVESIHDLNRRTKDGRGSYRDVVKGINILHKDGLITTARMTITKESIPEMYNSVKHLFDLGFTNVAYQLNTLCKEDELFDETDLEKLKEEYKKITQLFGENLLARKLALFDQLYGYMKAVIFRPGRSECSFLSMNKILIDPIGDLYRCEMSVGNQDFKIGDYIQGIDQEKFHSLSPPRLSERKKCQDCWLNRYCNGGCYFSAYITDHNFDDRKVYFCEDNKICFIHSIYLLTLFYMKDPDGFNILFLQENADKEGLKHDFEHYKKIGV